MLHTVFVALQGVTRVCSLHRRCTITPLSVHPLVFNSMYSTLGLFFSFFAIVKNAAVNYLYISLSACVATLFGWIILKIAKS